MEKVKSTKDYKIFKKKSGRFAVKNDKGKWVNADDKVKILSSEGFIKLSAPKKVEEPAAEEAAATEEAPTAE